VSIDPALPISLFSERSGAIKTGNINQFALFWEAQLAEIAPEKFLVYF